MTQVHFTLKQEEIQKLIEGSVKDDLSKNILTTVFNVNAGFKMMESPGRN